MTVLCISTYEKGQEFMRECKRQGASVILVTLEKLRNAAWPHECLDDIYYLPEEIQQASVIHAVSHLMRTRRIDRIVALDEFDMEVAAALREHLRIPGMGLTTMRFFRDKLAMRVEASEKGVRCPEFCPVFHYEDIRRYFATVPGPWVLKPRSEASAIGIRTIREPEEFWGSLEALGDKQSHCLLERFVPGEVFHVDSIVSERDVVFAEACRYGTPPMKVSHEGGVFTTRVLERGSEEAGRLLEINRRLIAALRLVRGVTHAEFIRGEADGELYFLECAARVGGAYISDMIEAATGVNLWREWARIELAAGQGYRPPEAAKDYAAVLVSLARQEHPDTSGYDDPEIALRVSKYHHAGFVLKSPDPARLRELLESYKARFAHDFMAFHPVPDKPTA